MRQSDERRDDCGIWANKRGETDRQTMNEMWGPSKMTYVYNGIRVK